MIKWLFKYGAVIFLLNSILLSIESTYGIGNKIFLTLMVIFLFALLINPKQIKNILFHKAFLFLLILNLINLLYFFLFHSIYDYDAIRYLMARSIQFSIISTSIYFNYEYYKDKFLDHIVYIVFGLVLFGLVINPNLFSGRYSGVIWNPNMFASLIVIAFSIHFLKYEKRTYLDYFILVTLLISAIASGSRGSLVAIIIAFYFKYGFSFRNIVYGSLIILLSVFIATYNLETSINRFADQSLFNDRILQFKYAYLSFKEKILTGYGLDKYSYIDKSLVPIYLKGVIIGAHNGYLAILTQHGVIFGSLILYLIFRKSFQAYTFFKNKIGFERVYLFIVFYTLMASIYESFMTGINEFNTILFWFSLAILSYSKFREEYEF